MIASEVSFKFLWNIFINVTKIWTKTQQKIMPFVIMHQIFLKPLCKTHSKMQFPQLSQKPINNRSHYFDWNRPSNTPSPVEYSLFPLTLLPQHAAPGVIEEIGKPFASFFSTEKEATCCRIAIKEASDAIFYSRLRWYLVPCFPELPPGNYILKCEPAAQTDF